MYLYLLASSVLGKPICELETIKYIERSTIGLKCPWIGRWKVLLLRIDTSGGGAICSAGFNEVWIGYYPSTYYIMCAIR